MDPTTIAAAGPDQRTPNLTPIIEQIITQPTWSTGNAVALTITGTGSRVAESHNGSPTQAPKLHIEWTTGGPPTNQPPVVTATGTSFVWPGQTTLSATITDDGLPNPPATVTTTWTKLTGPGTVTFANPNNPNTTATVTTPGTYQLRLTVTDTTLTTTTDITITAVDPASGASISFAALGDYGADLPGTAAVAALIAARNPDIVVTAGDNSYGAAPIDVNVGQNYSAYIGDYTGAYGPEAATNRFFPSPGNHDYYDGGGIAAYTAYFTLPGVGIPTMATSGTELYYDFVQGPVHFFIVDSNPQQPDGITVASAQASWLQTGMAASTSPWQVVVLHHPPFSSAEHGDTVALQWPFAAWGADLVIAGHDHTYERLAVDGIPYVVTGLGESPGTTW